MKIPYYRFFRISINHMLSQSLLLGALVTMGWVSSNLVLIPKADAQTSASVNNTEITKYARALLVMEPARQQAFDEIKKIIGNKEVPEIVCNNTQSIKGLPNRARDIAKNYCNRSQKIVQENGLTIERFNNITVNLQNDQNLKRQVYNTLLRLQRNP
jgi:hypothetical protein